MTCVKKYRFSRTLNQSFVTGTYNRWAQFPNCLYSLVEKQAVPNQEIGRFGYQRCRHYFLNYDIVKFLEFFLHIAIIYNVQDSSYKKTCIKMSLVEPEVNIYFTCGH